MGTVNAADLIGTRISSGGKMGDLTVTGAILSSTVTASGDLGKISTGAQLSDSSASPNGIDSSTFEAGGSIGAIESFGAAAITGSAFNAGQNIGDLTLHGDLKGSVLVAGVQLFNFAGDLSLAGDFTDDAAAGFGFNGGSSGASSPASIGAIQMLAATMGGALPGISDTTIMASITGSNSDGHFGTIADATVSGQFHRRCHSRGHEPRHPRIRRARKDDGGQHRHRHRNCDRWQRERHRRHPRPAPRPTRMGASPAPPLFPTPVSAR